MRILGPNCVGLLVPAIGLNASFAHVPAPAGNLAFVSQSGALVTAVLDWAGSRGIGFSKFVSLGDAADVDVGDVLDYLASDPDTRSILLYIEAISGARKFMSAARAAARNKPVIVVKSGRADAGARAAFSHTGAMAGSDAVYDAAIRRSGMLRVYTTEDLFDAAETLARMRPLNGERLAIVTNGGGPGVMAADALDAVRGVLAPLSPATLRSLDDTLPPNWSHGNPVDIIGDAPADRYVRALEALLAEPNADAVLLIHAPTAIVRSEDIARAVVPTLRTAKRNALTCWLGGDGVRSARALCAEAGVATYDTPEDAVAAFQQMVAYRRNQALLMQVPPARATEVHDAARARALTQHAASEGRAELSAVEAQAVLAAYAIPTVPTRRAFTPEDAVQAATEIGFPVVLKVLSRGVSHKSDVGGVMLDLANAAAVRAAAAAIEQRMRTERPDAPLEGFVVQPMIRRPRAHELIAGIATDPVFGPVILFGQGGTATEVVADRALALPPLDTVLARDLIERTRVARLLAGYRDRAPVDLNALATTLVQLSALAADLPEIAELDINPLLADERGVIALDARVRVAHRAGVPFAIRPYPEELEQRVDWEGRAVLLRPIRPEDGEAHRRFFATLDPEDVRYRTFMQLRTLAPSQLARLTQIDYDREMAFIATAQDENGDSETLGVARAIGDPDNLAAEFAIVLRSDLKGRGLGRILLGKLIAYCSERGTGELVGEALTDNVRMIALAREFGFDVVPAGAPGIVSMRLPLRSAAAAD